jgi:demethylmenaquinone methyltransferase/2-methoxy-6-polyprenyl-1,4-benzoquinol methylase
VRNRYRGPESGTIQEMFRAISRRYDLANDVLSFGIHRLWRSRLVRWSGAKAGDRVLDCATGTGDLAIAFRRAVGGGGRVVGIDFVPDMVDLARAKARGLSGVRFATADVMSLPFADDSFDIVSISFGIRNVSDPIAAVQEMARVLRPEGRLMVLEFGQPSGGLFAKIYAVYRTRLLPTIGGWVTGEREAYAYLERSSGRFPAGEAFDVLLREAGSFGSSAFRALSGGIAYAYRAEKSA